MKGIEEKRTEWAALFGSTAAVQVSGYGDISAFDVLSTQCLPDTIVFCYPWAVLPLVRASPRLLKSVPWCCG